MTGAAPLRSGTRRAVSYHRALATVTSALEQRMKTLRDRTWVAFATMAAASLVVIASCTTATEPAGSLAGNALSMSAESTTDPAWMPKRRPSGQEYRVPASIDATGSRNVSSAMAAFIGGVPDGSTIVFPAGSTYLLDDNGIVLSGRRNLTFAGNGARIEFTGCGTNNSAFKLRGTTGITIEDLVLVGDNPGSYKVGCESSEGVAMYGAHDTTISRVDVRRPYGHCWYAEQSSRGDGSTGDWTDGVLIEDSRCTKAGVMGLAIVAGRNITIEGTTLTDVSLFPFDIEPHDSDGGGENVVMRDNVIDGYGISTSYTPWLLAAAPDIGSINDLRFVRNHVSKGASHGATLAGLATRIDGDQPKRNIVIRDNTTVAAGAGPVMRFANVTGLTVTGNEQPLTKGSLVSCSGCTNTTTQ